MEILSALDHPNIIRIYNVYETDEKVFILLEVSRLVILNIVTDCSVVS